jgi:hypothetical protein
VEAMGQSGVTVERMAAHFDDIEIQACRLLLLRPRHISTTRRSSIDKRCAGRQCWVVGEWERRLSILCGYLFK